MTALLYVQWNPEAQAWHAEARDSEQGYGRPPLFQGTLPPWVGVDAGDATLMRLASADLKRHVQARSSRVVVLRPRVHAEPCPRPA